LTNTDISTQRDTFRALVGHYEFDEAKELKKVVNLTSADNLISNIYDHKPDKYETLNDNLNSNVYVNNPYKKKENSNVYDTHNNINYKQELLKDKKYDYLEHSTKAMVILDNHK